MHADRTFLRSLLSQLLTERSDTQLLYIPRGEEGMRRMIRHLIAMRPSTQNDPLEEMIQTFLAQDASSPHTKTDV